MARLRTQIWVSALIRRVVISGAFAAVSRHGDDTAGTVLVKVNRLDGRADVYAASTAPDGTRQWYCPVGDVGAVTEEDADAHLRRAADFDPDVWVVEIEDRQGRSFLDDLEF